MKCKVVSMLVRVAVLLTIIPRSSIAVSGIAVYTKDGARSVQYYGTVDGQLWRRDIVNDIPQTPVMLFAGPCTRPCINPSGTKVAFLKGSKVAIIGINGGTVTELADAHQNAMLDFPHDNWIYFTMGGFHESSSKYLKRVSSSGGAVQDVRTFPCRIAQIQISNDLSRAVIRPGDHESGEWTGTVTAVDMNTWNMRILSSAWSCGVGLFSDGVHVMDGWGAHDGYDIRRWDNGNSVALSFSHATAQGWPPNNGASLAGNLNHAIFHTGGATNDPKWMCLAIGGQRDYIWDAMVLENWVDRRCIKVTQGLSGKFDHGDFWVGTPGQPQNPVMNLSPSSLAFQALANGANPSPQNVAVGNSASGTTLNTVTFAVQYAQGSNWLTVSRSGTGNSQVLANSVNISGLAPGTYNATVTVTCANASPTTAAYQVTLTIRQSQPTDYIQRFLSLRAGSDYTIDGATINQDLLNGEDIADPGQNDTVRINNVLYTWTLVEDADGVWADNAADDNFVAYWSVVVVVGADMDARLKFRHDDELKVWVYGALVVNESGWDGGAEKTSAPFRLHTGANRLLFKLHEGNGGNLFAARLVDAAGNPIPGITFDYSRGGLPTTGIITVNSPGQGATVSVGDELIVRWTIDPRRLYSGVTVEFSPDDGDRWTGLLSQAIMAGDSRYYSGNTGTFRWTIPSQVTGPDWTASTVSSQCRMRVIAPYQAGMPQGLSGLFSVRAMAVGAGPAMHASGAPAFEVSRASGRQTMSLLVRVPGGWTVTVADMRGRTVAVRAGRGPADLRFPVTGRSMCVARCETAGRACTLVLR